MTLRQSELSPRLVYYVLEGGQAFAFAVMFTVSTVYFVRAVGLDPLQLVLVGTVLEGTALLCEVPTGVIADTYSRRASIIVGVLLLGAAFALTGALPRFETVLLAQVISGIGYTFLSGATDAWLADEVGEAQVGAVYLRGGQIARAAGLLGTVVSVGLASLALNLPYLAGGGLLAALGAFLVWTMPERGFRAAPREGRPAWFGLGRTLRAGVAVVRRETLLLMLLGVELFSGAASEGFDRLGDAHLLANFTFPSLGPLQPVVWFGLLSLSAGLLSLVVVESLRGRLEALTRRPAATARLLLWLSALSVASVIAFAVTASFALAFAALMLKAVLGALTRPLYTSWLVQHTEAPVRATVISMMGQTNALGQVAGGPGIGLIGRAISLRAAIAVAGLLLSPAVGLYARALRRGEAASDTEPVPPASELQHPGDPEKARGEQRRGDQRER